MVFPCSLNTEPTKNPYARRGVDNVGVESGENKTCLLFTSKKHRETLNPSH